jgi:Xaa-Pro aminopeptidase
MLTAAACKTRRQRLWNAVPDRVEWILIADPKNLVYFSNYWQSPFSFRSNDAGAILILGRDCSAALVADQSLQSYCESAHVDEVVAPVWYRSIESPEHRRSYLIRNTLERLQQCPGTSLGLESGQISAAIAEGLRANRPRVEFVPLDATITNLRRAKDPDELNLLRLSMKAGEAGMKAALEGLRPGMTELEAYLLVERAAVEALGQQAIIYGDFVSGPRCEQGGGEPSDRKIESSDLFILDFSTVVHEYRGDFANTFAVGSQATPRQRELCAACLEAMHSGETVLKAGAAGRQVYEAVRNAFARQSLANHFPHHAGHGFGLGHPEPPFLVPQSADTLVAGDVVTLEPGLYIPGVAGMRYERNYLITESGYEVLSHHDLTIDVR